MDNFDHDERNMAVRDLTKLLGEHDGTLDPHIQEKYVIASFVTHKQMNEQMNKQRNQPTNPSGLQLHFWNDFAKTQIPTSKRCASTCKFCEPHLSYCFVVHVSAYVYFSIFIWVSSFTYKMGCHVWYPFCSSMDVYIVFCDEANIVAISSIFAQEACQKSEIRFKT